MEYLVKPSELIEYRASFPDNKRFIGCTDTGVCVQLSDRKLFFHEKQNGLIEYILNEPDTVFFTCVSPNGARIALLVDMDKLIRVYDAKTQELISTIYLTKYRLE